MRALELSISGLSARVCELPLPKEVQERFASWLPLKWQSAVEKRKSQSLGARWCAQEAALGLGITLSQLPLDEAGAPQWPEGVVGSLAHSETLAVAVVSANHRCVGVDVEELFDEKKLLLLSDTILTSREKQSLSADVFERCWELTSIFGLKEAAYKALYPEFKTFIDFPELEVDLLTLQVSHQSGRKLKAHLVRGMDHVISIVYS